jgi:hypothetical protein
MRSKEVFAMNERDTVGPYELADVVLGALGVDRSLATGFTLSGEGGTSLLLEVRRAVSAGPDQPATHVAERYDVAPNDGNAVALCQSVLRAFGIDLRRIVEFELVCDAGNVPTFCISRTVTSSDSAAFENVLRSVRLEPAGREDLGSLDVSPCLKRQCEMFHRAPDEQGSGAT